MRPSPITLALRLLLCTALLLVGGPAQADDEADSAAKRAMEKRKAEIVLKARIPLVVKKALDWLRAKQQTDGSFGSDLDERPGMPTTPGYTGQRLGRCALALYTLVHCGADRSDPTVNMGIEFLRKQYPKMLRRKASGEGATYTVALTLLFLHSLYVKQPLVLDEHGKPQFDRAASTKSNPFGLPTWARSIVDRSVPWLIKTRAPNGLFGYPNPTLKLKTPRRVKLPRKLREWNQTHGGSDNSNTQFAMLGLWAGFRLGKRVDRAVLLEIAERLMEYQSAQGPAHRRRWEPSLGESPTKERYAGPMDHARGFGYAPIFTAIASGPAGKPETESSVAELATGSMTSGGLSSLLIVKSMLREQQRSNAKLEARLDTAVWDAFAWLDKHYRVDGNPAAINTTGLSEEMAEALKSAPIPGMQAYWPLYYLYSLERACMISGKRFIGEHDWYMDGAQVIVSWQTKDGSFVPQPGKGDGPDIEVKQGEFIPDMTQPYMSLANTCFALLFLKRASLRPVGRIIDTAPPPKDH